MKIGDLVRPKEPYMSPPDDTEWLGVIVGWSGENPMVYWSINFPWEIEYEHQLEVAHESR